MQTLWRKGLLTFRSRQSTSVGVFFVRKRNGKLRLILDTRLVNTAFRDPPYVSLPTAAAFSRVEVEAGQVVYMAEADVADAFHRVRLPEGLED